MRMLRSTTIAFVASALFLTAVPAGSAGGVEGWVLVGYEGRITQASRDALVSLGAEGLTYAPHDSYLAYLDDEAAAAARDLDGVASVRPLEAAEKVDPALAASRESRPLTVSVLERRQAAVRAKLAVRFPITPGALARTGIRALVVLASPEEAFSIAQDPAVLYVGPASPSLGALDEMGDQIQAGNVNGTQVAPGYETWLDAHGLDGEGQVVSIVDSGIDPAHPDLLGRIRGRADYAPLGLTGNPVDEPVDTLGHGTHVAGIVAADANGLQPATRVEDPSGFLYGLGVAPKAELVDQNALSTVASGVLCGVRWPPPYEWSTLTRDALSHGASVWNASWWSCEDQRGNYIATSRTFDELARDADPQKPGDQEFTFVFSAGNSGPGENTVAAPASSKNVISVGATNNGRAGGIHLVAGFSSRGPAADGRILPTVVSPGASVVSTRSSASTAACSVPVAGGFTLYSSCSGTSMSAPHVAGAVALVRQWWEGSSEEPPSPAMTKGLLVNSATDLAAADIPNENEGWGRVNLGALFDPAAERILEDQTTVLTDLGEASTYRVRAADPSEPMKVTLVWTDPAGIPGANPALVNDLDLRVAMEDGSAYLGNHFAGGTSVLGGEPDRLNNLENVFLETPGDEVFRVEVAAANLPGDGAPGGDQTDQDYALIITNAVVVE